MDSFFGRGPRALGDGRGPRSCPLQPGRLRRGLPVHSVSPPPRLWEQDSSHRPASPAESCCLAPSPCFPPHSRPSCLPRATPPRPLPPRRLFLSVVDGLPKSVDEPRVPWMLAWSGRCAISVLPRNWRRLRSGLTDNHVHSLVHAHPFSSHPRSYLLFLRVPDSQRTLFHDPFVIN